MRCVSEKRVKAHLSRYKAAVADIHKTANYYEGYTGAIEFVLTMMETLPEATLRPMSDAPTGVPILVSTGKELREAFVSKDGVVNFSDCNLFDAHALGWRPI